MDAWTIALVVGVLIGVVIFVGWGPDIGRRRAGDDRRDGGPDAPSGPVVPSGGGGDAGAGSSP